MTNKLIPLLLFLFFALFLESCRCSYFHADSPIDSLLEFRKSLEPHRERSRYQIHELSSWSRDKDYCSWAGVTCSDTSHDVISLVLEAKSLRSSLSSHVLFPLFRIKTLINLTMSSYPFTGEIPGQGLLNLKRLKTLRLENNSFSGLIPRELCSLSDLTELSLSRNNLVGEIPLELFELENLRDVDLSENNIFLRDVAKLTLTSRSRRRRRSLSRLSLKSCNISGEFPLLLSQYTTLEVLDLSKNNLNGSFPEWLSRLDLQTLDLSSNKLTGSLPPRLFQSHKLKSLYLHGNAISGELPISIGEAISLEHLDLSWNHLNGSVPESVTRLGVLKTLDLSNNTLFGSLPVFSSHLLYVDLSRNRFTGSIPGTLVETVSTLNLGQNALSGNLPWNLSSSKLGMISDLNLQENNISGEIPMAISQLYQLRSLNLRKNSLTGKIPAHVSNLTQLKVLHLSYNGFTGEVPVTMLQNIPVINLGHNALSGNLPSKLKLSNSIRWEIVYLDLQGNNISGEIPTLVSVLFQLRFLNLRNNSLTGPIPCNISNQTQILDLSHNNLTGPIPPCLGSLYGMMKKPEVFGRTIPDELATVMEVIWKNAVQNLSAHQVGTYTLLDMSNNQLTGKVPDSLGFLTNLKTLNLSNNRLSGHIPDSLGDLTELESLDLSNNGFKGRIPQSFSDLKSLTVLVLSNNRLSGRIPTGPQMDRMNDPKNFANNSGLCGEQIQIQCEGKDLNQNAETEEEEAISWFSLPMVGSGYLVGFFFSTAFALQFADLERIQKCVTNCWS
uniref:Receptor-like protein 12 n=1 Tax=Noccaea caerulescens TaxID=107243 RepID=A0A1J3K8E5_NOCCA